MDVTLSPEQETIQRRAREFLDTECPKSTVRAMITDARGYDPVLWRKIADLGWLGFALPKEYGGEGGALLDLALLYEEIGRALMPGPHLTSSVYAARVLLASTNDTLKQSLLPAIASGAVIATVAQLEPSQEWTEDGVQATARRDGDQLTVDGQKLFVPHGAMADILLVAARLDGDIVVIAVDKDTPGVTVRAMTTFAGDHPADVRLDGARVSADRMLTGVGWPELRQAANVATTMLCAEMVGGCQFVLDLSVGYAKTREQFGKPIGAFQAIQHKAVAMVTETLGARLITYRTAWRLDQGVATDADIALAKAKCNHAYRLVTLEGHETHGGIGWSEEYDLQLYFRRRTMAETMYGGTNDHLATIADAIAARRLLEPDPIP